MGLLHVVFCRLNNDWRHDALQYLPPAERMGLWHWMPFWVNSETKAGNGTRVGVTEVISPVLSKVMALELSPLAICCNAPKYIRRPGKMGGGARLDCPAASSGEMGREGQS